MTNNPKILVDYTTKTKNFQLVFPINFEINIAADDSVRLLSNVLEEIDYTELYGEYSRKEKNNAVSPKNLFVDGTKIEANANKYTFVWKKTILKNQAKLQEKMHKELPALLERYNFKMYLAEDIKAKRLKKFIDKLEKLKFKSDIEFLNGKGKRKTVFQRDYELLSDWYEREKKYEHYLRRMKDRNSLSKTDETATFMHLKEDHMRNSQLKPAYNVQIAVDAEYIVATEIFNDRTDVNTFIPFMQKIENQLNIKYMYPTADAGYESEENYTYFENNGQKPCIKPANYEQTKTRKYRNDIGRAENMKYDDITDTYTCHYGRRLVNVGIRKSKTSSGYITEKTIYQCENCKDCPYKAQCIKNNARCNTPLEERTKRFELSKTFKKQREQMLKRITTEQGILLRMNRSIQVEGAFGLLKEDMGFRRFLTRGTANVRTEILLLCLAYNIQKLHNKTVGNRQGQFLHEIKAA